MSDKRPTEISIQDPLSQITRGERKALLTISAIGITIVKAGIVPSRISALGIEFSPTNQKAFLFMIALAIVYFLMAFIIYACADFIAWQISHIKAKKETLYNFESELEDILRKKLTTDLRDFTVKEQMRSTLEAHQVLKDKIFARDRIISAFPGPISFIRALFEFLFPIVLALYSIVVLLK